MRLSVIIPVYNEESTVHEVIERVKTVPIVDALNEPLEKEIVVVDDGSTDETSAVLCDAEEDPVVTVFTSPVNFGKGAAVRIGLTYVTGDVIIIQDADLELDPEEYPRLLEPILDGRADVVYGSRFKNGAKGVPWRTRVANRLLAWWTNLLYGSQLTDEATAYKVFRADVIHNLDLRCIGFEFCPEVTAKVLRSGYRIEEVPVGYHPRSQTKGKKVSYLRDGLKAVWTLLRYRWWRPAASPRPVPLTASHASKGLS
ncbi:MAG: glycosyltransferase family 2 protein [Armatimonadota bacterium]